MIESPPNFDALKGHVFSAFASLYDWEIKDRLELFLMRVLQEGSSLDPGDNNTSPSLSREGVLSDPLETQEAQDFFDEAVRDLFAILASDSGFPTGALRLGRAIVAKLPTEAKQGQFRGEFFAWFLRDPLRIALEFPEVISLHFPSFIKLTSQRMKRCYYNVTSARKHARGCSIGYGTALTNEPQMSSVLCEFVLLHPQHRITHVYADLHAKSIPPYSIMLES
jgi:hypothetical protein